MTRSGKIWRRQSAGNENKIPVTIRITELRFFAGYAAKKWPPFGAAEALFQELRARRENELKLVLVPFESFEPIADIGISRVVLLVYQLTKQGQAFSARQLIVLELELVLELRAVTSL